MARPRYKINSHDWLDCLDWLDYQLAQPEWITLHDHPIHTVGIHTLQECIAQWRSVERPTKDLCESVQDVLEASLTNDDWGRLRKSLSAKKRRRREKRLDTKPVNITLTSSAHQALIEYKELSGTATLSEAMEVGLLSAISDLRVKREHSMTEEIMSKLKLFKVSELVSIVEQYLVVASGRRSLANSCKIAHQLFLKRPDRDSLRLVRDRFAEDLVWNDTHLNINYKQLQLFE